jgi:hypothetical protein
MKRRKRMSTTTPDVKPTGTVALSLDEYGYEPGVTQEKLHLALLEACLMVAADAHNADEDAAADLDARRGRAAAALVDWAPAALMACGAEASRLIGASPKTVRPGFA